MSFKSKKSISTFLVLAVLFYFLEFPLLSQAQDPGNLLEKGIQYYDSAYFKEAVETLSLVIQGNPARDTQLKAHLYLALANTALNRPGESIIHYKKILELDPLFQLNKEEYPPAIIKSFEEIKQSYPVVFDFSLSPGDFYPYKGDQPSLIFKLSVPDTLKISLSIGEITIDKTSNHYTGPGSQTYKWNWNDELIGLKKLDISMVPVSNQQEYEFKKEINFDITMPGKLKYDNRQFGIVGQIFKSETKVVKKRRSKFLWGILGGAALGFLAYSVKENSETGEVYTNGQRFAHGALIGGLVSAGSVISYFTVTKKIYVPHQENIEFNKKLKQEIEDLKKQVKVTQESQSHQE